jgi:hypothetical protein
VADVVDLPGVRSGGVEGMPAEYSHVATVGRHLARLLETLDELVLPETPAMRCRNCAGNASLSSTTLPSEPVDRRPSLIQ